MIIEENNNEILNKRNNKIISGLIHEGGQFRRSSSLENTAYGSGKDGVEFEKYAVDVRNPEITHIQSSIYESKSKEVSSIHQVRKSP
jgi:hypothetical protein